jgi:hypothetical protein
VSSRICTNVILLFLLILLSVASGWAQDYTFTYTCDDQGDIIHPDSLGLFYTDLTNTGAQPDTYRVVVDKELPVPWQVLACLPTICFTEQATVSLEPDSSVRISVDIMPVGFSGSGTVTMRVTSKGDTTQSVALPLTAITNTGVDVLIVDDDGTQDYEIYYQAALDSVGKTHGTLDNATTAIGAQKLAPFPAVIWFTGEATPLLTVRDRQAISGYLEAGGRLFISGQDIASALCDPASGESDANSIAWFEDIFLAQYEGEYSGPLFLEGFEGHPISNGLSLNISGGDGANNQAKPDLLELFGGIEWVPVPIPLFSYADGYYIEGSSALDEFLTGYKLVYFAFGFEAIDNASDRALLMKRIMDWLMSPTPVEDQAESITHPQYFFLSPNYPNPFNAATTFALYIPGECLASVSLKIYNVLGQEMRTLMDGPLSPGSHLVLWDGKDDAGANLASGVYFSRMESGNFSQTRKIVLTR